MIPFWIEGELYQTPLFIMLCISKQFPYEKPEMKIVYPDDPVHKAMELKSSSVRKQ